MRYCYRCFGLGSIPCAACQGVGCKRCHGNRKVKCPICSNGIGDPAYDAYAVVVGIIVALGVVAWFW